MNYIKKRSIQLNHLTVGYMYTRPLLNKYGEVLLPAFHKIHPWYLEEWKPEQIITEGEIYIENQDTNTKNDIISGYIEPEVRNLLYSYNESVSKFKNMVQNISEMNLNTLQQFVTPWVYQVLNTNDYSILLSASRYLVYDKSDYIYVHCIDTMIFSLCIYSTSQKTPIYSELLKLGISALLCDVGMFLVPLDLRNSTMNLTNEQKKEIEKHCILGYNFIIKKIGLSTTYAEPALEHHERADGSGYPRGMKYNDVHPFTCVIALADVFTSQLRCKNFQNKKEPIEILKNFVNTMMSTFIHSEKQFMSAFISLITLYPVTSVVKLSTNDIGIVIRTKSKYPTQPTILLLFNENQEPYKEKKIINLMKNEFQNIKITGFYTQDILKELQNKYYL